MKVNKIYFIAVLSILPLAFALEASAQICRGYWKYEVFRSCVHSSHPPASYNVRAQAPCPLERVEYVSDRSCPAATYKECAHPNHGVRDVSTRRVIIERPDLCDPDRNGGRCDARSLCLEFINTDSGRAAVLRVTRREDVRREDVQVGGLVSSESNSRRREGGTKVVYRIDCQVDVRIPSYNLARSSNCEVATREACRARDVYQACEHESFGPRTFKSLRSAACPVESADVYLAPGLTSEQVLGVMGLSPGEARMTCSTCDHLQTTVERAQCINRNLRDATFLRTPLVVENLQRELQNLAR